MSPRKAVQSKRKSTENVRTVRKGTSQLNRTVNLKVSIPIAQSTVEGVHNPIVKGRCAPRFTKRLDVQTKLELANSVARQQLVKEETPVLAPDNIVVINTKPQNRRGRKKAPKVSDFFLKRVITEKSPEKIITSTTTKTVSNACGKNTTPKKKEEPTRRIITRKRLADTTAQVPVKLAKLDSKTDAETVNTNIKVEAVPEEPNSCPVKEPQPIDSQPQPAKPGPKVIQPTGKRTKSTTRPPRIRKPPATRQVNRTPRKPGPKSKRELPKSPSILELLNKKSEPEINKQKNPGLVESRKTSVSSNSNKSWTRDISSSSNAVSINSVCSTDFVRFNKKLPVLKLTNIDSEVNKRNVARETVAAASLTKPDEELSDAYNSDSSDSSKKFSGPINESNANSLRLTSNRSSRLSQSRKKDSCPDYDKAADKLSLTMEKLDMEIINWISSENDDVSVNLAKFRDKMFDILDKEFGVITHCRRLKEILEPTTADEALEETCLSDREEDNRVNIANKDTEDPLLEGNDKDPEVEFVEPRPCRKLSTTSEGNISNVCTRVTRDDFSDDELPAVTNYDHHDDDDALSLYAESISGFESSRINVSTGSAPVTKARPVEEYVPQPIKDNFTSITEKHTYSPTKITEDTEVVATKIPPICEKQNADSTSIYKQSNSTGDTESYQDFTENNDLDTRLRVPDMIQKPRLMESFFEGAPKARSVLFANICFYNLMNCCRNVFNGHCRFSHVIPTSAQISSKLALLDEKKFIHDYLSLRNWPDIRRRYGMCFVEECAKRGLTRILVEMAYDSIVKANSDSEEDTRLRVDAIERTLLHLNTVDLGLCEDLLKLPVRPEQSYSNRTLLCDVLMATMSITQNFSRFKIIFLNLTYFMVDNDRTFNKDVVEHILERVCILPFERPMAKALIQMMRLTKSDIFNNSMIRLFEKQISEHKEVLEEYMLLKNQCALTSLLASSVLPTSPAPDADPQPPAASPDTTNFDNMNKSGEVPSKPKITRTIGMNPLIFNRSALSPGTSRPHVNPSPLNQASPGSSRPHVIPGPRDQANPGSSRPLVNSDSSTSDDSVNMNIRTWRNRSIFPHMLPPPMATPPPGYRPMRPPRPQMRPHMVSQRMPFMQRLVKFKSPFSYVNRQPGPKY